MDDEFVIYYELLYSVNKERIQKLVTLDIDEINTKTSEVILGGNDNVHFRFYRYSGTRKTFLLEVRKAAIC